MPTNIIYIVTGYTSLFPLLWCLVHTQGNVHNNALIALCKHKKKSLALLIFRTNTKYYSFSFSSYNLKFSICIQVEYLQFSHPQHNRSLQCILCNWQIFLILMQIWSIFLAISHPTLYQSYHQIAGKSIVKVIRETRTS